MTDEIYREFKALRQKRHREWREINTAVLDASGIPYKRADYTGNCYLIREVGRPKVDYYPSTGRWVSGGQVYNGGATKFIRWYRSAVSEEHTTGSGSDREVEHSAHLSRQ
jgi:hypothetical protein